MPGQPPQWQPIGKVFLVGTLVDSMVENAQEQYALLQEARPKPHVLDDDTVRRVVEVYTAQRDDLWLWDEQLRRWDAASPTGIRCREVERLQRQMITLHDVIAAILTLANDLKWGTIDAVRAKDDVEVGLEMLLWHMGDEKP